MMTEERFKETNYKMSYEEYKKCRCDECDKADCIHRNAYRRLPEVDGGLGLCPNLKGEWLIGDNAVKRYSWNASDIE